MRYLVTGGCGFIGTNLVQALLAAGHSVKVVDNDPKNKSIVGVSITDIRDPLMGAIVAGADVVIHLAAETGVQPSVENPLFTTDVNVNGTLNLLDACVQNGVKRFIFASSGTVLGNASPPFKEDMMTRPSSPYGASKLAGEAYCHAYCRTYGLETVVLRFSNIYGPWAWHKSNLFVQFIKAILRKETLRIYGDGHQTRDFLYVKDLVEAIKLASTVEDIGDQVFQIASGKETSVMDLCRTMNMIAMTYAGRAVEYIHEPSRAGEPRRSYAYNSYAKLMLGWKPEYELVDGMLETFKWYMRNYGDE